MQFGRPLDELLGTRAKVTLLRALIRTRAELTGRELARQVGLDAKTCHAALQELAEQGVVELQRVGRAIIYRLNDKHALVQILLVPLFEREGALIEAYAKDLVSLLGTPESLILFGSVARGEERPTSDVDLLFVTGGATAARKAAEGLDRAAVDLAARYGSVPQVLVYDRKAFQDLARKGDPFISEVLRTGRVIRGKPLSEILKRVS